MEAISNQDMDNYAEELGDLWLHLLLHSVIAEENDAFELADVLTKASEKAISRHPHVFASDHDADAATVLSKWQERKGKNSDDESVPPTCLPGHFACKMRLITTAWIGKTLCN